GRTAGAGNDVLDQDGARGGAVAGPQLVAVARLAGPVAGGEIEASVDVREKPRDRTIGIGGAAAATHPHIPPERELGLSRVDVLDQDGPGGGAITLPQFLAGAAVFAAEVERTADIGQVV